MYGLIELQYKNIEMKNKADRPKNNMQISEHEDRLLLTDLFELETLQQLQENFTKATNVASIITHPDGTPITKPSNFTYLCGNIVRHTETGTRLCFQSDKELGQYSDKGPRINKCLGMGLWDAGAAISVEGRHIGNWLIGQVRDETQTEEDIRKHARLIGADEEETVRAFQKVPYMPMKQFELIAKLLYNLANQLSETAYKNLTLRKNISEKNIIEKELKESQSRFKSLVETTTDFIWELDTQARFLYVSPQAKQLLGYEPEELIGTSGFDLMPPDEAKKIEAQFSEYVEQGLPFRNLQNINLHKDGHKVYLESNGEPFFDDSGRLLGYRGSDRDITERIKMEEQIIQSQKMEALGQLAGGVAHDFNNMLTGIMGNAELLLLEMEDKPEYAAHLSMIIEAADRAADLARNLLVFGNRKALSFQPLDLIEILKSTLEIFKKVMDKKITLSLELEAEKTQVKGMESQLQSVFMNLLINASHAMPKGGHIHINSSNITLKKQYCLQSPFDLEPGTYISISVKDTGEGIPKENLHRVFDPFFTTKDTGKGTGLGLSAVYSTLHQHRGMISLNSELMKGTEFVLFFPVL